MNVFSDMFVSLHNTHIQANPEDVSIIIIIIILADY